MVRVCSFTHWIHTVLPSVFGSWNFLWQNKKTTELSVVRFAKRRPTLTGCPQLPSALSSTCDERRISASTSVLRCSRTEYAALLILRFLELLAPPKSRGYSFNSIFISISSLLIVHRADRTLWCLVVGGILNIKKTTEYQWFIVRSDVLLSQGEAPNYHRR